MTNNNPKARSIEKQLTSDSSNEKCAIEKKQALCGDCHKSGSKGSHI